MKVATGLAIGSKAKPELAALAVASAMGKAGITSPACVLLFLTSEFAADPQSAIKAAAKAASCTNIIGCSAMGIFTEEDWVIDSPAAAAMVFSDNVFSQPNSTEASDAEPSNTEPSNTLLLTLTAPNAIDTRWLNASALNCTQMRFGGVSGDAIGHGPFSIWQNAKGTSQGYCEFVLNNTNSAIAATHGLKIISSPRKITASSGHDLLSMANVPALNTLKSAWQKHAKSAEALPYHQLMAVYAGKSAQIERGDYNVASLITGNDENASVTLAKPMQIGSWLSWAIRDIDAAQIDIVRTASVLRRQLDAEPQFSLLFSCLGRGPYFYNGLDQDLVLIKALFPHLPIIGFYGNGEIAPIHGKNELLQYSAVLGLFSDKSAIKS